MVTPLTDEIWDSMVAGAEIDALATELRVRHPRARDLNEKLTIFLDRLWSAGLLEGSEPRSSPPGRRVEIRIDPLARAVASMLRWVPRSLAIAAIATMAAVSLCGLLLLILEARQPRLRYLFDHMTICGVLVIVLVLVPLHELGHAVTCRLLGMPCGPLGIRLSRVALPRPYVDTSPAWGLEQTRLRAWIPAGGPLMDVLVGGAAAWMLIACDPSDELKSILRLVFLYAWIAVNVGTSPLPVGDGSHILEALLNDEFARDAALLGRRNRFVRPHSVWIYRAACVGHVLYTGTLFFTLR